MQFVVLVSVIAILMFLKIILVIFNKKTMWSCEILLILEKASVVTLIVPILLWTISDALYFFIGIKINQWLILALIIGVIVLIVKHELTENKSQKVLLRISKENIPKFLQILSSKFMLSKTETLHETVSVLFFYRFEEYSICNTDKKKLITITNRGTIQVKASKLLLKEISVSYFKQECWNAYKQIVVKTSPYFYLLPVLSFITFIVSMILFAHFYEFTFLYIMQLLNFALYPMILFASMFSVNADIKTN
jgi:hypothetical protein